MKKRILALVLSMGLLLHMTLPGTLAVSLDEAGTVSTFTTDLSCTQEEHTHDDTCRAAEPSCGLTETEGHTHSDSCKEMTFSCTLPEDENHTHNDDCYTQSIICGQEEAAAHSHTADCYALICGKTEHQHTDGCYAAPEPTAPETTVPETTAETQPETTASPETEPEIIPENQEDIALVEADDVVTLNGVGYATLEAAVEAANADTSGDTQTITLLQDVKIAAAMTVTGNITIEGDEYELTYGEGYAADIFVIESTGTLTVNKLTIEGGFLGKLDSRYLTPETYIYPTNRTDASTYPLTSTEGVSTTGDIFTNKGKLYVKESRIQNFLSMQGSSWGDGLIVKIRADGTYTMFDGVTITNCINSGSGTLFNNNRGNNDGGENAVFIMKNSSVTYTRARKLTPRMLNELIEKIEVFNAEKIDGVWEQRLRIHYNCVGVIEIPRVLPLPVPEVTVNTRKGVYVSYAEMTELAV